MRWWHELPRPGTGRDSASPQCGRPRTTGITPTAGPEEVAPRLYQSCPPRILWMLGWSFLPPRLAHLQNLESLRMRALVAGAQATPTHCWFLEG
jgi:hypothetical protein